MIDSVFNGSRHAYSEPIERRRRVELVVDQGQRKPSSRTENGDKETSYLVVPHEILDESINWLLRSFQ